MHFFHPYAPSYCACALLTHATCSPWYPCESPEYIYHKVVFHFTTWIFGPFTTKRQLIVRHLGGDHTFYTHFQEHFHGWNCMHVKSHVVNLFIVNACNVGGYIKLLAPLKIF
jgi:hypothetical protein